MKNTPLVSINCITYNQEKYIATAINSFLAQKTNFEFEILIHDDASTDNTVKILKDFQKKYPDKIKLILQKENQFQKKIKILSLNERRSNAKYIAVCEGDDYWISPDKLQKQVEYMENNPDCSMIFHDAILVDEDQSFLGEFPGTYKRKEGIKKINELNFIPTASKLYRQKYIIDVPSWFHDAPHGDFSNMLICSNYGYIYYLDEKMSAYRTNVNGSLLFNEMKKYKINPKSQIRQINLRIEELQKYNKWSKYKKNDLISEMIINEEFKKECLNKKFLNLHKKKYKVILKQLTAQSKAKLYLKILLPDSLYLYGVKIKNRML